MSIYSATGYSDTADGGRWGTGGSVDMFGGGLEGAAGRPGYAKCSGAITATFDWVPEYNGEPRPASVIVRQVATATWSGDSGNCSNGLGSSAVTAPDGSGATCTGVKLEVINSPAQQFTRSCSPQAEAYVTVPGTAPVFAAAALAYFRAEAYVPKIELSGSVIDGSGACLVLMGQRVTSSMVFIPSHFGLNDSGVHSGNVTPTSGSYFWNPSGDTFKAYSVGAAPDFCPGEVIYLTQDDLVGDTASWCWRGRDKPIDWPVSGSCEVTIDGIAAPSRAIAGLTATIKRPGFDISAQVTPVSYVTNFLGNNAGVRVGSTGVSGFRIWGSVTTQYPFDSQGSEWRVVQLIKSIRSADEETVLNTFGQYWLDTEYPYPASPSYPYPWAADGSHHETQDNPSQGANHSVFISESFRMYVLYRPGGNADWVPIVYRSWEWHVSAENTGSGWTPVLDMGSSQNNGSVDSYDAHPEWINRVGGEEGPR